MSHTAGLTTIEDDILQGISWQSVIRINSVVRIYIFFDNRVLRIQEKFCLLIGEKRLTVFLECILFVHFAGHCF